MSEFDVNLIRAFAKCPAFYDKSNPNFKDRAFTENAWKEISLQLGFDEKVLRDRMFQLRNRYNLEKRKVEMQDGDPNAKSTWPLFDHMTFLEGHIRPRKSYKSIMNRSMENNVGHHQQLNAQFSANNMFFNHRNTPAGVRPGYPQHSVHRLQQLANHFQMMGGTNDDSQIDLSGDSLSGGLALEMAMLEDDRLNPLQLFQQQQQQHPQLNLQQQFQQQQQRQQMRRDAGDHNSEIKTEYYSDSDDDEDILDHNGENNNKNLDSGDMSGTDRLMDGQQSSSDQGQQMLGGPVSVMSNEGVTAGNSGNESQLRNGSIDGSANGTGCDMGNEEDDTLAINPMDLLMNRSSVGSNHSGVNFRYLEALKRKGDALNNQPQTQPQHSTRGGSLDVRPHSQPSTNTQNNNKGLVFKRRRRNYQNMVPHHMANGPTSSNNDNGGTAAGNLSFGQGTNFHASQASNALLANQAMLLAKLQSNLVQNPCFQTATSFPALQMLGCSNKNNNNSQRSVTSDKYTAFGQFLSSSLSELDSLKAMDLIGKFTMELVNALKEQKNVEGSAGTTAPLMIGKTGNLFNQLNENGSSSINSANLGTDGCSNGIVDDKFPTPQF